jgi:membrane protease YdiL (CAAX protease family)
MSENSTQTADQPSQPGRLRYFVDITLVIMATLGVEVLFGAFYAPTGLKAELVYDMASRAPVILLAWLLLWLRGENVANIGLKRPSSWRWTILIGLIVAAATFGAIYLTEKVGIHRDLSYFKAVQGNLPLARLGVGYSFLVGFYEEFMFRGFLFYGLAMLFGGSRGAWLAACLIQSVLFGAAHSYQNPIGMLITGTLGLISGLVYLGCGRNLWPTIIGQWCYNTCRFVLFYFHGPPGA